jgi:hypothetical protein
VFFSYGKETHHTKGLKEGVISLCAFVLTVYRMLCPRCLWCMSFFMTVLSLMTDIHAVNDTLIALTSLTPYIHDVNDTMIV